MLHIYVYMSEFPGVPKYTDEELEAFRRVAEEDRRPTKQELANFSVTPERWSTAMRAYYAYGRKYMINAAAKSRDTATSYRGFLVGASAMGIEPNHSADEPAIYYSGNFKYFPGESRGAEKRCAERNVLDGAQGQAKVIVALVTVSKELHTDDPVKARGHVLRPCKECRDLFRACLAEGFMRKETIICNVNDAGETPIIEERTLSEFLGLYKDYR